MKNKDSQKTEDEVLDQTFGGDQTFDGFDEEMTGQTQDQTQTGSGEPAKKKAASTSSSNTLLFVAGGVAAVGILGYMFVVKPMLAPASVPAKSSQQAVLPEPLPALPPVVNAPVQAPSVATPERQVATDYLLNGNTPVPAVPVEQTPSVLAPVPPVVQQVNPQVVIPTLPVIPEVPVSSANASSVAMVEELGRKFDVQGQQFRIALDDVGNKVTNLEKFRDEQLGINVNFDERITKLELGGSVKTVKPVVKQPSTNNSNVVRKAPVRTARVKEITEIREPRDLRNLRNSSNILIDKRQYQSEQSRVDIKSKDVKVKESTPEYNVHSIYGGRIWLKNSDGSLSTYTSGDKLPSGELIKSVDDEKYLVNTDRGSFNKK